MPSNSGKVAVASRPRRLSEDDVAVLHDGDDPLAVELGLEHPPVRVRRRPAAAGEHGQESGRGHDPTVRRTGAVLSAVAGTDWLTTLGDRMMATGRRRGAPVLVGAICVLGLTMGSGPPASASAADTEARRPVALVLVRDLVWATAPPAVDGFAKANLSMRTAESRSGAADVYLTLGKGARSGAPADEAEAAVGRGEPVAGGGLRLAAWKELVEHDRGLHYGGALGSVGGAFEAAGRELALVGNLGDNSEAAAVAVDADGLLPPSFPGTLAGLESAMASGPDALVVAVQAGLQEVLRVLDGTCALVVSASTPDENRHLGVLAASPGCGLGTAGLGSPSTHHDHLATLPDVSRTFLHLAGVAPPSTVGGGVVTPTAAVGRQDLVERDRRTWTSDRSRTAFVWLFVILHLLGAVVAVRWRRARTVVACVLLAIPPASLLMMLVPWWRGGAWVGLVVGGLVAAVIAMGGVALARARGRVTRSSPSGAWPR